MNFAQILTQLNKDGLILQADAHFPSLTGLITGESLKGSWWGHPRGKEIFNLSNELGDHIDVMVAKLVSGKVTFIHRWLWPAVIGVGQERAQWQLKKLSPVASALFERVEKEGEVKPEALVVGRQASAKAFGPFITELEKRLLVLDSVCSCSPSSHARNIFSWNKWAEKHACKEKPLPSATARATLEGVVAQLNQQHHAKADLPWPLK